MLKALTLYTLSFALLSSFAPAHAQRGPAGAVDQVRAAETAFAKSMADRNATAFASLLADEAVFFGSKTVQHGKPEVVAAWSEASRHFVNLAQLQDRVGERIAKAIPLGRVASAEDIAGPIVFLCSPLARHITGEIVNVNGGSVLCG